jgi:DNA mismatch repair ATPase MutL
MGEMASLSGTLPEGCSERADSSSTQLASHPVGTTVRVTDLFKHIPVRRQTVLKSTAKTMARIKRIIQSYAIAQPTIRLSLKVLKATSEKANWVYAPGRNATLMDAALKVAGTEVSSACVVKQWPCGNDSVEESESGNDSSFQLTALLVDPGLGIYSPLDLELG